MPLELTSISGGEGVVTQAGAVELIQNKMFHGFGSQAREQCQ
jgi:hypothetical protein